MFTHNLVEHLGIDNRLPNEPITDDHKDLAASIQERYEELFFEIIKDAQAFFYSENLSLGGGCAYNGCANGKVVEKGLFKKLWVPPAPSDAGSCIGSCLDYLVNVKKLKVRVPPNPFLGPSFTDNEIQSVLNKYGNKVFYRKQTKDKLVSRTAHYLNLGLVVGWFQDNIEFGARALGNRSILANPTFPKMQEKINKVIKKREGFRPFAPMVIFEQQDKFFESREFIPYMNQVVKVRAEHRDKLPAVTHVDGTARVQSVLPNSLIYQLLKEFEQRSGYPILLNTSFNVKDKTMVLTPEDAILTYLDTAMDILVMGDYIIYKNDKNNTR
jgi:carbamoyltransferase